MTNSSTPSGNDVVIERIFDAPLELVWKMWTDPEHFKAWYGPTGASVPVANLDVQVGGKRLVSMAMETPNGPMEMWFAGEFREVVANERLVYTDGMSDEEGNIKTPAEMGMPEGTPASTEVIVEFSVVDGKIKMVMTHVGVPADSGGAGGWAMAFDKLDAHITASKG